MVNRGKVLERQIRKGQIPLHILIKLQDWVEDVEQRGIAEVRKIPGYHDEPCHGTLRGVRSIRLGKGWRGYYSVYEGASKLIVVQRIDKHAYGK